MCLAIPNKVIKIKGQWAWVKSNNHRHKVSLSLLKNVKVGDYILIHENLALNKIPKSEARRILNMIKKFSAPSR